MTDEQARKLEYPFTADEIEWRVLRTNRDKTKGQVAAFIDSRAIQNRLDMVLGRGNWQNRFITVPGKDNSGTAHICELSIFYPEKGEWITKSDGAGCTDIEPIKGGLSNAFKRAASMWGLGRYLYGLTDVWTGLKDGKYIPDTELPKLARIYKEYVNKYLARSSGPAAAGQKDPISTAGRFAPEKQDPLLSNVYRIKDLKTSRGRSGPQSLVVLQSPTGETVSGYILGNHDLQPGQSIQSPKIVTKEAPNVGRYNIIEGYEKAA